MGSFFAGVKAGTLGGILYIGGLVAFNVFLLFLFKADAISVISGSDKCPSIATGNATSAEDCFNLVVSVYPELLGFEGFIMAVAFSGIFGAVYDSFPFDGAVARGETVAAALGVSLNGLGFAGLFFARTQSLVLGVFLILWTAVYGVVLGRLYARYTGTVRFEDTGRAEAKVMVDGRDQTGRKRTFALKSIHRLTAEPPEGRSFKKWIQSGGVTVNDLMSFETEFELAGDGSLRAETTAEN